MSDATRACLVTHHCFEYFGFSIAHFPFHELAIREAEGTEDGVRNCTLRAVRQLTLLAFAFYGVSAFGQYPGVPKQNDSPFPGGPALAANSVAMRGTRESSLQSSLPDSNGASLFPDLRDDPGRGTISVVELQHPLSSKGRRLILKAQDDLRKGQIGQCFKDLDKAMKVRSAVPYAHGVRGAAYLLAGRTADAIPELQQAVQVLPLPANYSNLGYAYLLNGDADRGERALRQALQLHNAPPQARYLMGLILLDRKSQNAEACGQLFRAQNLMPTAHAALAVCYQRGGQEDAADRQIRDLLGPMHQSEFESWKKWVAALAAQAHPSSVFGVPIQRESTAEAR